MTQPVNSVT